MRFRVYFGDGTRTEEIEAVDPKEAGEIARTNPLRQMRVAKGHPSANQILKIKRVRT